MAVFLVIRINSHFPTLTVNGGGNKILNSKNVKLSTSRDFDLGSGHMINRYRPLLTRQISLESEKLLGDGRKYGQTDMETGFIGFSPSKEST